MLLMHLQCHYAAVCGYMASCADGMPTALLVSAVGQNPDPHDMEDWIPLFGSDFHDENDVYSSVERMLRKTNHQLRVVCPREKRLIIERLLTPTSPREVL